MNMNMRNQSRIYRGLNCNSTWTVQWNINNNLIYEIRKPNTRITINIFNIHVEQVNKTSVKKKRPFSTECSRTKQMVSYNQLRESADGINECHFVSFPCCTFHIKHSMSKLQRVLSIHVAMNQIITFSL